MAGWDALETDLLEAANLDEQAAQLGERVRSATQVVVDAILDLLDAGVFRLFAASQSWGQPQLPANNADLLSTVFFSINHRGRNNKGL